MKKFDRDKELAAAKAQAVKALKRSFSRSKIALAIKNEAIVQGRLGLRGGKLVKCSCCERNIPHYKAQVDHVDPVCPIELSLNSMTMDMLYARLFCSIKNLQVLCPDCHLVKSNHEKTERAKWRKLKKYLVCRSKYGSKIKVIPIINLKDPELEEWDILAVYRIRKDADSDARLRRKT